MNPLLFAVCDYYKNTPIKILPTEDIKDFRSHEDPIPPLPPLPAATAPEHAAAAVPAPAAATAPSHVPAASPKLAPAAAVEQGHAEQVPLPSVAHQAIPPPPHPANAHAPSPSQAHAPPPRSPSTAFAQPLSTSPLRVQHECPLVHPGCGEAPLQNTVGSPGGIHDAERHLTLSAVLVLGSCYNSMQHLCTAMPHFTEGPRQKCLGDTRPHCW